jgi:hypothetical protein
LEQLQGLDATIRTRPQTPEIGFAPTALLDQIRASAPVIVPRPRRPQEPSWLSRLPWVPLSGLAAGLLLAWGVWGDRTPRTQPTAVARVARYDLLQRQVQHLVRLSTTRKPAEKIEAWTNLSDDLRREVTALQQIAPAEELQQLQTLYARSVESGVVSLAANWPARGQRRERTLTLRRAEERLAQAETEAQALAQQAPHHARPTFEAMAAIARAGRDRLRQLEAIEEVAS